MQQTPQANYALMRASMQLFHKGQAELDAHEREAAMQQVNKELAIGKRILESGFATGVLITEAAVNESIQQLIDRFDSEAEFDRALAENNLDRTGLREAILQELKVEAVTEKLLSESACVDEHEVEIYYYQHLDRFDLPETRTARHILITINEDYPENRPDAAKQRVEGIRSKVSGADSFKKEAQKHSECPTAMHEGLLGRIKPGQLYPELDAALFEMVEGQCSGIIRTEVGLHLLYCEAIHPAQRLSFDEVRDKLHDHLLSKKRKRVLKEWLQQSQAA